MGAPVILFLLVPWGQVVVLARGRAISDKETLFVDTAHVLRIVEVLLGRRGSAPDMFSSTNGFSRTCVTWDHTHSNRNVCKSTYRWEVPAQLQLLLQQVYSFA